jgi:hypothetical protein
LLIAPYALALFRQDRLSLPWALFRQIRTAVSVALFGQKRSPPYMKAFLCFFRTRQFPVYQGIIREF